jgi:hypothetical protein
MEAGVAREVWQLRKDSFRDFGVALGRDAHVEAG